MTTTQAPSTITRWRWTLTSLDEVERYLSQMCAEGWLPVLASAGGRRFVFVHTEPGEYVCTSAATVKMSGFTEGSFDRGKYVELTDLVEAQGATVVLQTGTWGGQEGIIAVRRADQGPLVINSDTHSKIDDLKARRKYHTTLGLTFFPLATMWLPLVPTMGAASIGASLCVFAVAGKYGWNANKYSKEIKRLERDRSVFE